MLRIRKTEQTETREFSQQSRLEDEVTIDEVLVKQGRARSEEFYGTDFGMIEGINYPWFGHNVQDVWGLGQLKGEAGSLEERVKWRAKDVIWGDIILQELGPGEKPERARTSQGSATDEANRLCRELE